MRVTSILPLALCSLLLVSGCTSSKDGGGPDTITVSGQVRNTFGGGLAGIPVLVADVLVTSDASGNFTVEDVEAPYDIAAYSATASYLSVYLGASRPDPILSLEGTGDRGGAFDVTLSPASTGPEESRVSIAGPYNYSNGGGDPDAFQISGTWAGGASLPARVFVTRVIATNGVIATVLDHAMEEVTFEDNQSSALPIAMSAMPTTALTSTVTVPGGYEVFAHTASSVLVNSSDYALFHGQSSANPLTFRAFDSALYDTLVQSIVVPTAGSLSDGYGLGAMTVGGSVTGVTLEPPPRLDLSTPASGAPFTAGTAVSWTGPLTGAAGYRLLAYPEVAGITIDVWLGSSTSVVAVPDLAAIGAPLPTGAYRFLVEGIDPGPTTDDVLDGRISRTQGLGDFLVSVSESRSVVAQ